MIAIPARRKFIFLIFTRSMVRDERVIIEIKQKMDRNKNIVNIISIKYSNRDCIKNEKILDAILFQYPRYTIQKYYCNPIKNINIIITYDCTFIELFEVGQKNGKCFSMFFVMLYLF